jgi:CRP/FNR family transcriptional regulator, cyclic AMP receptor protein
VNEEQQVELLSGVDIFEDLPKEEVREILDDLLRRNAEINLRVGEVFYTPKQPDGKLFILKQGRVRIYKMDRSREFTLEVVEAGTVFGEVAFTPHALREAYAEAMESSILLAMERSQRYSYGLILWSVAAVGEPTQHVFEPDGLHRLGDGFI